MNTLVSCGLLKGLRDFFVWYESLKANISYCFIPFLKTMYDIPIKTNKNRGATLNSDSEINFTETKVESYVLFIISNYN